MTDLADSAAAWTLAVTLMFVIPAASGVPMDKPGLELTLVENAVWIVSVLLAAPFLILAFHPSIARSWGDTSE